MNRLITLFFYVACAASAIGQEQCGPSHCAPQPIVIQLSCGSGSSHSHSYPPPHRPPPPPPHHTTTAAPPPFFTNAPSPSHFESFADDPDKEYCWFASAGGYETTQYPSPNEVLTAFPSGFTVEYDAMTGQRYGVMAQYDHAVPPYNWDGRFDSLGFEAPPKGSPFYNMLLCWPYVQSTVHQRPIDGPMSDNSTHSGSNTGFSLQDDEDRNYCEFTQRSENMWSPKPNSVLTEFPHGFGLYIQSDGKTWATVPTDYSGYPYPDYNWDGSPETLGFPMPAKGTAHYNMLLCYPYGNQFYVSVPGG